MFKRQFFLVCPSFHGATLLAKLLNAHPEVVGLGDTYPSNRNGEICGCGTPLNRCEYWQAVMSEALPVAHESGRHIYSLYPRLAGGSLDRCFYLGLSLTRLNKLVPKERQEQFLSKYRAFLTAVHEQEHNSPSVFVDGVKSLSRIRALSAFDREMVSGVIHLVREPGDFAKSCNRKNPGIKQFVSSIARWRAYHRVAGGLSSAMPYLRIHYEQLATNPDAVIGRIFRFMDVDNLNMNELMGNMGSRWHFLGNASLNSFDGSIVRSHHPLSWMEKMAVKSLVGVQGHAPDG